MDAPQPSRRQFICEQMSPIKATEAALLALVPKTCWGDAAHTRLDQDATCIEGIFYAVIE